MADIISISQLKNLAQERCEINNITENALKIIREFLRNFIIKITKLAVSFIVEQRRKGIMNGKKIVEEHIEQVYPRITRLYYMNYTPYERERMKEYKRAVELLDEGSTKQIFFDELEELKAKNLLYFNWSMIRCLMTDNGAEVVERYGVNYLIISCIYLTQEILTEAEKIRISSGKVRLIEEGLIEGVLEDYKEEYEL